ncbi:MAG: DUF3305 domain-containing protein [Betaproteobacteria bacterium]|nr:MAG: DUF3305 domain-containing protein [Betaproteobacteria bacterium]
MQKPSFPVAVVMQRRASSNRWQSEFWEPRSVLPGHVGGGEPSLLVEREGIQQWLYPGLALQLHRDEAEGYYLNVATAHPKVFVRWHMVQDRGVPDLLTLSYNEASRWLDGGEPVDSVPMPPELYLWAGEFVEEHYRPEPRKRIRPRSFQHPRDREQR